MILLFVSCLLVLMGVLLSVAFFTLFERKILGLTQSRMGPNKILWGGIFQPVVDGLKLLFKDFFFPQFSSLWGFIFAPMFYFGFMILLWGNSMTFFLFNSHNLGLFFVLCILGGSVYTSLLTGVNSFSKFALIGGIRSAAQTISYEICLAFFLFSFLIVWSTMSLSFSGILSVWGIVFWFFLILSETNRAPFDFAEGESELISGFNVEFSSAGFVFLFLGEYGMILFLSFFSCYLMSFNFVFLTVLFSFLVVLVRSTLPRFRYDLLMGLCWVFCLPSCVFIMMIFILLKFS